MDRFGPTVERKKSWAIKNLRQGAIVESTIDRLRSHAHERGGAGVGRHGTRDSPVRHPPSTRTPHAPSTTRPQGLKRAERDPRMAWARWLPGPTTRTRRMAHASTFAGLGAGGAQPAHARRDDGQGGPPAGVDRTAAGPPRAAVPRRVPARGQARAILHMLFCALHMRLHMHA
jgi:hypothetical protein